MKIFFIFCILIFLSDGLFAQSQNNKPVVSNFATQQSRLQLHKKLVDSSIYGYLSLPPVDSNDGLWNHAFWAIELLEYKNDFVKTRLNEAWKNCDSLSEFFQKNLLEATYSLYPEEFIKPVNDLLNNTSSARIFVRCAEYLLRADASEKNVNDIRSLMQAKFTSVNDVAIIILQNRLNTFYDKVVLPPMKDLLDKNFLKNQTIIYSFQRKNRDYPGMVMIRKPDGSFARNKDGSIFHTSQLARAITNYPFYITNGNSPQGILRWTGFEVSKNNYIGPTPNLQLVLPYEATPAIFFDDSNLVNTTWQTDLYASLLPQSWKYYDGIYESFFAGAMGRNEVIMHGTTIDPSYYKGRSYYPQTPSLGCLCSYEEWDKTGKRIKSNQQQIVDMLDDIESNEGYVVVIELDDEKRAVNIDDVLPLITIVEKSNKAELQNE